ncbi:MAG: PHB depolymerase family esterase [Paracoccaceae bacterium]
MPFSTLLLRLAALICLLALPAEAQLRELRLGDRFYLIDLPANPDGAPLILALHGGGGDPAQFASSSGFAGAATARGYAVVFPAGSSRRGKDRLLTWNAGYCCGHAARAGVDDQDFLRAVIADATARFGLDPRRVFLTGLSNGSMMAETFAARNAGALRAVAGVAGTMDTARTRVTAALPLLVIHGTADTSVPYDGGRGESSRTRTKFASVDSVIQAFLRAHPGPLAQTTRHIDRRNDGTSVEITDWQSGGQVRLRLIAVLGGVHHWPGARNPRQSTGKTREIDANTEILRFFDQYR